MSGHGDSVENGLRQVRQFYERTAQEVRREQQALRELHRLLLELSQQSLRLHEQSSAVLNAINRDLQKVQAQMKRMATARR